MYISLRSCSYGSTSNARAALLLLYCCFTAALIAVPLAPLRMRVRGAQPQVHSLLLYCCFTADLPLLYRRFTVPLAPLRRRVQGAQPQVHSQFTCFTRTTVQILTPTVPTCVGGAQPKRPRHARKNPFSATKTPDFAAGDGGHLRGRSVGG